jgi:hypothetical protein
MIEKYHYVLLIILFSKKQIKTDKLRNENYIRNVGTFKTKLSEWKHVHNNQNRIVVIKNTELSNTWLTSHDQQECMALV